MFCKQGRLSQSDFVTSTLKLNVFNFDKKLLNFPKIMKKIDKVKENSDIRDIKY